MEYLNANHSLVCYIYIPSRIRTSLSFEQQNNQKSLLFSRVWKQANETSVSEEGKFFESHTTIDDQGQCVIFSDW